MRITLRTLLAYRDRVLSAADHDDLHHRIQQSEAAGNVLKRIHTVATMPNILAPPVLGKGLGGDPNSIAEYLDDALPSAKVPELEKICLVSDAQLAELAHCHEILSTAMSTKVHVPESLKGRVAGLSDTAQRTLLAEEIRSRTQQTPPDQGDASSQSSDQKATLQRVDAAHPTPAPMGRRRVVATQVGGDDSSSTSDAVQVQSPMVASGGNSIKPAGLDLEHSALAHEVPEYLLGASSSQWKMPAAIAVLLGVLLLVAWQALGPWDGISSLLTAEPTGLAVQPEHLAGAKPAENKTNDVVLAPISPPTDAPAGANPTAVDGAATNEPVPSGAASDGATAPPAAESPTESQTPNTPPEAPQADNVAPILAASDALLNWHPQIDRERAAVLLAQTGNGVRRLEPGEGLANEDVLIVPPATRTTLELHNGLLWSTNGATIMRVKQTGGANADSPAVLEPLLCRATVRGAANGRKLELATVVGTYAIELGEAGSRISIEMGFRSTEHGQVHDRGAVQPVMVVIVLEGAASLSTLSPEAQGTSSSLTLGNGWAMVGSEPPQSFALKSIPPWLRNDFVRPVDLQAAADLSSLVQSTQTEEQLLSATRHPRPETAALAVQTSLLAGNWFPLVSGFLGNERMRSHWNNTLLLARQVLAMDPAAVIELEQALTTAYGEVDGQRRLKRICGIPLSEFEGEGLLPFVSELESKSVEDRVLASFQIEQLTGQQHGVQPHAPSRTSIQNLRRELGTKRIQMTVPGDPIWERVSP